MTTPTPAPAPQPAPAGDFPGKTLGIVGLVLALLGGLAGAALGSIGVFVYAWLRAQPPVVPVHVLIGGPIIAIAVGVIAGLYPAMSASRLSPTIALRTV